MKYQNVTGAKVTTPVPGPTSVRLLEKQRSVESNAVSYPRRLPIAIQRGFGSYVEDVDKNIYIDFLTGAGSLPLGHNPPAVIDAAKGQMDEYVHGLDFPSPVKSEFIDAQFSMLPVSMRDEMKIHFCGPTGADAIEAAVKLCKRYTGADEVLSFQGGYHGCTHAGMSLSGLRSMKARVPNRMPGVHFFPYSHCYRCPLGLERATCKTNCATYFENALRDPNSGLGRVAAVLLEMVQGEGGVIPADPEFVMRLRAVTRELNIPLIVDEIQTGCGRTGTWFAFERYGIEPDVVVYSKGISGMGAPVSLMLYRKKMDVWEPGAHIGTFRGNHVAFAAGIATIRAFEREGILEQVRAKEAYLREFFADPAHGSRLIGDVRGLGLMWGIEIVDPADGSPSSVLAARIQSSALKRGLIVELGGRDDCVVRLLPPLNLSADTLQEALDILISAIGEVQEEWQVKPRLGETYCI
jgi:diaminobutyrate-2-oxoglutarate transaminase